MSNILLLGGNGFLGKNIILELLSRNKHKIYSFDLYRPADPIEGCSYYYGGLQDTILIEKIMNECKIDIIIHLVSSLIPSSNEADYLNEVSNIYIPTLKILKLCSEKKIKFIYMSSGGTVYGDYQGCVKESFDLKPISLYGLSKLQMENMIKFYNHSYNLQYLILRPSNPYGIGQNLYGKQGLISVVLGKILNNDIVNIFGDGNSVRDYIYVKDFSYYIAELLELKIINDTFNIGSGVGYSINQILDIIKSVTKCNLNIEYKESRKNDVSEFILDITKLQSIIKHDQVDIRHGISDYYNMIKNTIK